MVLSYAFCNVSVMPLKADPDHRSEQVSQALFGERIEVLQVNNKEWAQVRCKWDDYTAWAKLSQLQLVSFKSYRKEVKYITAAHQCKLILPNSEVLLPLGAELFGLKQNKLLLGDVQAKFKGKKKVNAIDKTEKNNLINAALQYLHAPYQWGGRSIMGIDCSGLSQMAFKLCGIAIPRDAADQANQGELVDFLQNALCGDLAFFENADGKIVHVGILLDKDTIIHATDAGGKVVIDSIDPAGIISRSLKKRTHQLRFVKRMIF